MFKDEISPNLVALIARPGLVSEPGIF
jgi:hypothetical protein